MKKSNLFILLVAVMMALPATMFAQSTNPVPVHRPLLEEYTGTWCGWCIRGMVGMNLLNETFGENFIGVAYHNGDAMQIMNSNGYPNNINGYPSAFLERTYDVDPYTGFGNSSAQMLSDYQQMSEIATIADLRIDAKFTSEAKDYIQVDVTSYFTENDNSGKYALEVMLIEDDLFGTGSLWNQENYYSGYSQFANDPYLGYWVTQPGTITGLHFNDVLICTSKVIANSIPAEITAYEEYTYTYTFNLNRLPKPALLQNKDKLHIVAIIVDKTVGKAGKCINANKAYISDFQNPVITGDVNDDGLVNTADISTLIMSLLAGDMSTINVENSKIDDDDIISLGDVTALIRMLLSGE